ncbi:MAG: helix-turn-helix transcriptional regulator [Gluconacetobacter diazotrophicus]|nr:helix-turn-helix transcriptional regulator [Gluconacetobacter diazotrophicus]
MRKRVVLVEEDAARLETLGRRLRAARLRRNLSQAEVAARAGVTRKTFAALEAGDSGVSVGCLMKVLAILGFAERLETLADADPAGIDLEAAIGRRRAGTRTDVEDF